MEFPIVAGSLPSTGYKKSVGPNGVAPDIGPTVETIWYNPI